MTVQKLFYNNRIIDIDKVDTNKENDELGRLVYISMLCNDTKIGENKQLTGDPTETALIDMGFKLDLLQLYLIKCQELKKFHLIQREN